MSGTEFWLRKRFVTNELVEKNPKSRRVSPKKNLQFKKQLGLNLYVVTCDEQDIISTL